jgi:hypothetical protein
MSSMPFASKSPKGKGNNRETTLNRQDLVKGGRQTTAKSPGTHSADSTLSRPSALKRQLMKMNGMTK